MFLLIDSIDVIDVFSFGPSPSFSTKIHPAPSESPQTHEAPGRTRWRRFLGSFLQLEHVVTHRIHVWYIYLHLAEIYGKCGYVYIYPYMDPVGYSIKEVNEGSYLSCQYIIVRPSDVASCNGGIWWNTVDIFHIGRHRLMMSLCH